VDSVQATDATRTCFLLLDNPAPGTAFLTAERPADQVAVSLYLYLYLYLFGETGAAVKDE
jgi:hypothetical protein